MTSDTIINALGSKQDDIAGELCSAIDGDELRLDYQPIYCLKTGAIVEVEALVRWQHPRRGLIGPAEFIWLAEETGLITPLGNWVLRQAVRQFKQWQSEIPGLDDLAVTVNVSGRQLARQNVATEVQHVLNDFAIDPRHLKLEITETTMMESGSPAIAELIVLREIGTDLHLDDFGTGYSSLSYLRHLPIEALKIDRSFIQPIESDYFGKRIVQGIVALAHSLEMAVTAEGVETESQARFLTGIGCDKAQGYHFAKPAPASEVGELLKTAVRRKANAA